MILLTFLKQIIRLFISVDLIIMDKILRIGEWRKCLSFLLRRHIEFSLFDNVNEACLGIIYLLGECMWLLFVWALFDLTTASHLLLLLFFWCFLFIRRHRGCGLFLIFLLLQYPAQYLFVFIPFLHFYLLFWCLLNILLCCL